MKIKLLVFALLFSILSEAQITKAEAFVTGTKLAFYPNQCGNTIPEAAGKLTFCDRIDNLGVVERSYGLSDRRAERMLPNYFNQDEVYVTGNGLSIRKVDGTWENIPNIAIPTFNTQGDWTNAATIQNGLVLPDGKVIIQATNASYGFNVFDRTLKTFTPVNFPNNRFPSLFAYDAVRDLTWIVAFGGGANGRFLFTYDGTNLNFIQELNNTSQISTNVNSSTLIYHVDHLYASSAGGLFKINITDYLTSNVTITQYNATTTPSLPFDRTLDLQFDDNDTLWLAQSNNNNSDGGLIKFDITNETYEIYQLERESNPSLNHGFQKLAIDDSGGVWATAISSSSLYTLTFPADIETWETTTDEDLTSLGVPITYVPNNIYFRNNKFYFTTVDFSSGSNSNYEVIINDNGIWSGRNDDDLGNLSNKMNRRFTNVQPDDIGGVWWFNAFDDIVVYRDNDDNHQFIDLENIAFTAVVDDDNKAIVRGGNPNELRKIDFPNANSIQNDVNEVNDMKRVLDQIWVFDRGNKKIDAYKNDVLIHTYDLDEDWYQNVFDFAADDDGNAWFMQNNSGSLIIKKFDIQTLTTTTYDAEVPDVSLSTLRKVVSAPNGGVWFLGALGTVYQENGVFYDFMAADFPEIYSLRDIVVDTNGKAYLLNNDSASITTIENPTDVNPIVANTSLENTNTVLPSLDHYRPSALTIDSDGSMWTHASLNTFKLIDDDVASEYISSPDVLSVTSVILDDDIRVYPIPATDMVHVSSTIPVDELQLFDLLGKTLLEVKSSQHLNVSQIHSGVYLLKIRIGTLIKTQKIIIN